MKDLEKDRLLELLADEAFFALSEEDERELERLKIEFPELKTDASFEMSAAAINLAALDANEEMPARLRAKISSSAEEFFSQNQIAQKVSDAAPETRENLVSTEVAPIRDYEEIEPKRPFWQWLGWAVAAAACVALAVNVWTTRFQSQPETANNPPAVQTPTPELSVEAQRAQLLAKTKDIVQTAWAEANPAKAKNISGDVVWSNSEQKGYMRFRGLPPNDPNKETYQLWIFDEEQDAKTPINGGVFDVNANGEVVVPINAEIKVRKPKMFAVTKEKPGGVVVSKREEIMTIAKV